MGCCLSAGKVTAPPVSATAATQIPPPLEEESVKEVVVQSVSVSVVPVPVPVPVPDIVPSAPEVSDSEPHLPLSLPIPTREISQNKSDICSVTPSHSFSTATTATAASILEDDALSKPHRPPPPPPPSTSRRNRPERFSRSPGDRYSPQGKLRPRLVRERPSPQPNPTHIRRNVDSGPRSGSLDGPPRHRSGSPATRSARRSPMKKREEAPEKDVKKKKEETRVDVEVKKEDASTVRDPQVSMECFIFL